MKALAALLVLVIGELAAAWPVFWMLRKKLGPGQPAGEGAEAPDPSQPKKGDWTVFKGVLERAVLLVGLLAGYPQVIIAFGALKLGTRLHEDFEEPAPQTSPPSRKHKENISNNYFLIGNLVSILLAMFYALAADRLAGWWLPPNY